MAAVLRVLLGILLILGALDSRAPLALRILGVFIIVAGLMTPVFGVERFRRVLDWWNSRGPPFQHAWAGIAVVFGLLLV